MPYVLRLALVAALLLTAGCFLSREGRQVEYVCASCHTSCAPMSTLIPSDGLELRRCWPSAQGAQLSVEHLRVISTDQWWIFELRAETPDLAVFLGLDVPEREIEYCDFSSREFEFAKRVLESIGRPDVRFFQNGAIRPIPASHEQMCSSGARRITSP